MLLAAAACYGAAAGILNVALVAYAAGHGGPGWAGVLIAIWGAGSLAGGLLYGSRTWPAPVHWRAVSCLALFSLALLPLAAPESSKHHQRRAARLGGHNQARMLDSPDVIDAGGRKAATCAG